LVVHWAAGVPPGQGGSTPSPCCGEGCRRSRERREPWSLLQRPRGGGGTGHKIGEVVGFPPVVVFILNVVGVPKVSQKARAWGLGRCSGCLGAAGEPPHDVPGGGHKIGEDVGSPPVVVSILDVVVVEGDVLLDRRGHVDKGVRREEFFCGERERWAILFF
jgi:hypothetical protein